MTNLQPDEIRDVRRTMLRLNAQAWGVSFGLLLGLALFIGTLVLVIRGGENIGVHLGLLAVYLPGYRVTVAGAFLGFVYLFVIGYGLGRLIGAVYNRAAGLGRG